MTCKNCDFLAQKARSLTFKIIALESKVLELDQGWKGKDHINIKQNDDVWVITEHRKNKSTGEIAEITHQIDHNAVVFLAKLIVRLTRFGVTTKYVEIIKEIIRMQNLPCTRNSFNGGENRANYYFPLYYWPMKILEHLKYVEYGGQGNVRILKNFGLDVVMEVEKKPKGLENWIKK